jgi:hypothetical protein
MVSQRLYLRTSSTCARHHTSRSMFGLRQASDWPLLSTQPQPTHHTGHNSTQKVKSSSARGAVDPAPHPHGSLLPRTGQLNTRHQMPIGQHSVVCNKHTQARPLHDCTLSHTQLHQQTSPSTQICGSEFQGPGPIKASQAMRAYSTPRRLPASVLHLWPRLLGTHAQQQRRSALLHMSHHNSKKYPPYVPTALLSA